MREGGDLEQGVAGDVGQVGRIGIYFRGRISGTYCCNLLSKTLGVLKCVELNCVDVSSMPCQPVGKGRSQWPKPRFGLHGALTHTF